MRNKTEEIQQPQGNNVSEIADSVEGSQVEDMKDRLFHSVEGWQVEQVFAVIVVCIIVPWIVIGNFLVITSIARFKKLQIPTNYFLLMLAIADIMTALMVPLILCTELLAHRISNVYVCLVPQCCILTFCAVSVLCLVAIAYDRYIALAMPLKYVHMVTVKKFTLFVIFSLIYAVTLTWLPILTWHHGKKIAVASCSVGIVKKEAWILLLGLLCGPVFIIIFFCYSKIYIIARRHARAIAAVEVSVRRTVEMHYFMKDTKCAKTLAIVIGFYLLSWIPFQLCLLLEVSTDIKITPWCRNFMALLAYCNSGMNPWVYAYKNSDFRSAFKKLIQEVFTKCRLPGKCSSGAATSDLVSELPASSSILRLCRTESRPNPSDLIKIMYSPEYHEYHRAMVQKQLARDSNSVLSEATTSSPANQSVSKKKLTASNSNDSGFVDATHGIPDGGFVKK